jgi:TRAP-type C4-dicarboxylate transport system permease small subunit
LQEPTEAGREGLLERLSRFLAWFSGAAILFCAVLVTLDVFARNIFNDNLFESFEITIYLYAVTVAFSFSFALTTKTHIRIDVVYARFPRVGRVILDLVAMALLTGLSLVLCYYAWSLTVESFGMPGPGNLGAVSASDLSVPLVIPQSAWSLGLTWFALVCVVYMLRGLYMFVRGDLPGVSHLIGIEQREGEAELSEALHIMHEGEKR